MNSTPSTELPAIDGADPTAAVAAPALSEAPRRISLHPDILRVWTLGTLVFVVPALLITLVISLFTGNWIVVSVASPVGIVLVTAVHLHSRAWIRRFQCRLLDDGLWVDRGVFWRSEIFVARTRVQHTEVQQGPIARRYGIGSLKVFTAGAGNGEIEIDGLTHADALWLRDELLGRHSHDGV